MPVATAGGGRSKYTRPSGCSKPSCWISSSVCAKSFEVNGGSRKMMSHAGPCRRRKRWAGIANTSALAASSCAMLSLMACAALRLRSTKATCARPARQGLETQGAASGEQIKTASSVNFARQPVEQAPPGSSQGWSKVRNGREPELSPFPYTADNAHLVARHGLWWSNRDWRTSRGAFAV